VVVKESIVISCSDVLNEIQFCTGRDIYGLLHDIDIAKSLYPSMSIKSIYASLHISVGVKNCLRSLKLNDN
jgi:hypothetical protein